MVKQFKSRFVSDLDIAIDSYITESILINKIAWLSKKDQTKSKPTCAFWKQNVCKNDPWLLQLKTWYINELTYVKNLLKTFSAKVIISYIQERGIITFRYLDLDKQKTVIYNLWKKECEHQKTLRLQESKVSQIKDEDLTVKVEQKKTQKTKLSGIFN